LLFVGSAVMKNTSPSLGNGEPIVLNGSDPPVSLKMSVPSATFRPATINEPAPPDDGIKAAAFTSSPAKPVLMALKLVPLVVER
jgi:hypothetical protein